MHINTHADLRRAPLQILPRKLSILSTELMFLYSRLLLIFHSENSLVPHLLRKFTVQLFLEY